MMKTVEGQQAILSRLSGGSDSLKGLPESVAKGDLALSHESSSPMLFGLKEYGRCAERRTVRSQKVLALREGVEHSEHKG
jgi:hypothetical protein